MPLNGLVMEHLLPRDDVRAFVLDEQLEVPELLLAIRSTDVKFPVHVNPPQWTELVSSAGSSRWFIA